MRDAATALLKVSRPAFWIFPIIPFLGGAAVSGATVSGTLLFQAAALLFPFGLFVYGLNDIHDYESDQQNPRKGGPAGDVLPPAEHTRIHRSAVVAGMIVLVSALATARPSNIIVTAGLLATGAAYSVPPLRLKQRPPLDSIANGILYFYGPSLLGFSFGSAIGSYPFEAVWLGIVTMGFHAFTTIPDYTADKAAGDTTLAVRYGKRAAAGLAVVSVVSTLLFSGIENIIIRGFLLVAAVLYAFTLFRPREKTAHRIFWTLFLLGIPASLLFILQQTGMITL